MKLKKKHKIKSYQFISILEKMIAADLLKTVLSVLSVIVIIIVSRKFIKVLVKAIEGQISNEAVFNLLGLNIIVAVGEFLPAATFMTILMVLGRMYRDHEMAAIASAGGGVRGIYRAIFLLIFPLSLVATGLSLFATPWAEANIRELTHQNQKSVDIKGISAGQFTEFSQGELIFYTERIEENKRLINVFIQNKVGEKLGVINAKYGRMENLSGGLYLILEQGERIQGNPGELNFIIETFTEYAVRIETNTHTVYQKHEGRPSSLLWSSHQLLDVAEMQKRWATPLAVIFLSFLAVPLAKLSPRGGVYGSLLKAFGIYFIYGNLKRVNHSWVVNEIIPLWLGYFWVYLLLFLLGIMLLVRLFGIKWIIMFIKQRGIYQ